MRRFRPFQSRPLPRPSRSRALELRPAAWDRWASRAIGRACRRTSGLGTGRATRSVLGLVLLALIASTSGGCRSMWNRVRENERTFALENARTNAKRGNCREALESLDRAEAIMAIDAFAIEALQMRIRCYEKLGLGEVRDAHRRLVEDFYREEPMAFPAADGSSVFRVRSNTPVRFEPPPAWLAIERPRYSPYAQRSKLVGRVVLAFELAPGGRTTEIRVLEMPHPLLATWAIEAVAQAKPRRGMKDEVPVIQSERTFVTNFSFEWRWADEPGGAAAPGENGPSGPSEPNGPSRLR